MIVILFLYSIVKPDHNTPRAGRKEIEYGAVTTVDLPATPGTYVLWVRLDAPRSLVVGRLGAIDLPAGLYAYVGSAHGAGGLRARVNRHLRADKLVHWHIDRLTSQAPVGSIWWMASAERLECTWAQRLLTLGTPAAPRFGSSDCGCPAHLIALDEVIIPQAWAALDRPNVISR
jgi:Uri superfamily endonuclease